MRIFSTLIIFVLVGFLVIIGFGYTAPVEYEKTKSALYDDKVENIWKVLTIIESYPDKKRDIKKIEIIDRSFGNINTWREIYKNGNIREYQILQKNTPDFLAVEMSDTKSNKKGIWEYRLEEQDSRTKLIITEISENDSILKRGINTIFRRDSYIDAEFKWIRVSLFNNLLN